jgi:AcrR family transcriptional regulator
MAREPSRKPRSAGARAASATERTPPPSPPARDRAVDALMALAAEHDWDEIRLPDIAERAGISLADLRDLFPSKGAMLAAFSRRIDRIVLEGTGDELDGEPVRERVFDVMMRRLDALGPYREAMRRMAPVLRRDPLTLAALNQLALNSHRYMLEASGVDTEGPLGMVKVQGAALVFGRVLDTWLDDDDPGLARTMAALDRELQRGGRVIVALNDVCRLTAPFRAVFSRAAARGRRFRERQRARRDEERRPGDDDYVTAV